MRRRPPRRRLPRLRSSRRLRPATAASRPRRSETILPGISRGGAVPYFESADELYRYLGRLLQDLSVDPELGPRFRRANTIVQYRTHNPDAVVTSKLLDGQDGQVDCGETDLEPEVVLSMEADLAHRFWLGLVSPTKELARGNMRARGPVAKILKLVPLARPGFERYADRLRADGRDDLLEPLRAAQSR